MTTPHTRRSFLRAIGLGSLATPLALAAAKPSAPPPPATPREGEIVIRNDTPRCPYLYWSGENLHVLTARGGRYRIVSS